MPHGLVCELYLLCFLEDLTIESFVVDIRNLLLNLIFLLLCNHDLIFLLLVKAVIKLLLILLRVLLR